MSGGPLPRDAAIFYAEKFGWRVFPIWWVTDEGHCGCGKYNCTDRGKHPIGPCVPHGCNDGTTDPDLIAAWWERYHLAHVGISTGRRSGIFVIDVDPRHRGDENLPELEELWGKLPDTVECLTGGGGNHYFFKYPANEELRVTNKQNLGAPRGLAPDDPRLITGVDCRGSGGYIVAAPSGHESGNSYEWEASSRPGKAELAEIPTGWITAITTHVGDGKLPALPDDDDLVEATPEAKRLIKQQCELLQNAGDGARHSTRAEAGKRAGRLIKAGLISTGEALGALEEAAQANSSAEPWKIRKTLIDMMRIGLKFPWVPASAQGELPPPPGDADAPYTQGAATQGHQEPQGLPSEGSGAIAQKAPESASGDAAQKGPNLRVVGDDERGPTPSMAGKPFIVTNGREFIDVVDDAWRSVHKANEPPFLFDRGGGVMATAEISSDESKVEIGEITKRDHPLAIIARVARWRTRNKDGDLSVCRPDKDVALDMLTRPSKKLPKLDETPTAPMFDYDGYLIDTQGYDERSKVWLHFPPGFACPKISLHPKPEEVRGAVSLFRDELLVDFPFAEESDFAHAVAAHLLPFCRRMVSGPTPIHMIEATCPGTGKGFIASSINLVAQGCMPDPVTIGRDTEETRKRITSMLYRAQRVIQLDNLSGKLASADLAAVITSTTWSDRKLGETRMIDMPNNAVWIATANNPGMSLELARRCARIRLESLLDRPWERPASDFRHYPLADWIRKHREELVRACLILIQHWIAQKKPAGSEVLGSFEGWARVMGGILEAAEIPGFLANQADMYEAADDLTGDWRELAGAWWETYNRTPVTVTELRTLADDQNMIPSILGDKSEKSQASRLGRALRGMRGRVMGELQIHASTKGKRKMYALTIAGEAPQWGGAAQPSKEDLDQTDMFDG